MQLLRLKILVLAFIPLISLAEKVSKREIKASCSSVELKHKNCLLKAGDLRVGLSSLKIRFNEGPWTSIADFPAAEQTTHWQEAQILTLGQKKFLSIKAWRKIENEVALEELHWMVFEPEERRLHLHLDKMIGKRKMLKENETSRIQDDLKETKLWFEKGHWYWKVGKESGELKNGI